MECQKPWLSYEQQADRLEERGLAFDRADLVAHLADVGYYRLSGYWYIYKQNLGSDDESFVPGTSFEEVWDLYTFDRQLRLITLDAISLNTSSRSTVIRTDSRPTGHSSTSWTSA